MTNPLSVFTPRPDAEATAGTTDAGAATIVTLIAILMLPAAVFFLAETTSMAAGVLVAALGILLMRVLGVPGLQGLGGFGGDLAVAIFVVSLLSVHLVVCALTNEIGLVKAVGSLATAGATILACGTVAALFRTASDRQIRLAVNAAIILFLVSAAFSLAGIQPSSTTATSKPVFPFTEPSHFSGAILPLLAFLSVTARGWRRWMWIVTGFALGLLLENLSMIIGSLVITIVCLSAAQLTIFAGVVALVLPFLDLTYFLDRVRFDVTATTNLSTLVYIQGWELVDSAFRKTLGWGLGFQQLGFTFLNAPTSDLIIRLNGGNDLNLKEGSFGLSKLVSELGVFGIFLVLAHLQLAFKAFTSLRKVSIEGDVQRASYVIASCSIYTFLMEIYVRGTGYFSGPSMLAISSVFIIKIYDKEKAERDKKASK